MPPDERNTSDEHAILPFVGLNNWLRTRRTLAVVRPIAPIFDQSYNRFLPVSQPVSTGIPSRVSPVYPVGFHRYPSRALPVSQLDTNGYYMS